MFLISVDDPDRINGFAKRIATVTDFESMVYRFWVEQHAWFGHIYDIIAAVIQSYPSRA